MLYPENFLPWTFARRPVPQRPSSKTMLFPTSTLTFEHPLSPSSCSFNVDVPEPDTKIVQFNYDSNREQYSMRDTLFEGNRPKFSDLLLQSFSLFLAFRISLLEKAYLLGQFLSRAGPLITLVSRVMLHLPESLLQLAKCCCIMSKERSNLVGKNGKAIDKRSQ